MPKGKPAEPRETRMSLDGVEWIRCDRCGTHVPATRVLDWCARFGMSAAESQIVMHLASGTKRTRLARKLDRSQAVIKDQTRSLLHKANLPNIPALLRRIDLRPCLDHMEKAAE
jgi:DNA-binding CsgD family transcriptional regulator